MLLKQLCNGNHFKVNQTNHHQLDNDEAKLTVNYNSKQEQQQMKTLTHCGNTDGKLVTKHQSRECQV